MNPVSVVINTIREIRESLRVANGIADTIDQLDRAPSFGFAKQTRTSNANTVTETSQETSSNTDCDLLNESDW